jgi:large subunit ribosomal protein L11
MGKETVEVLIEGGKASAAPPIGSSLGPLKVNIGQIVGDINTKTAAFKGMKVPVKIIVDTETKAYEIVIGTPPASGLIKKELKLKSGSGWPNIDKVANMGMEEVLKVAQMKQDAFFSDNIRGAAKIIVGSANAMGILIEGKIAVQINPEMDQGKWDDVLNGSLLEVSPEKRVVLDQQLAAFKKAHAGDLAKIALAKKKAAEKVAK